MKSSPLYTAAQHVCWLLLITLAACGTAENAEQYTLTVFAAASLSDAFTEIGAAYEAENIGVTVQFNFAGSSTLAAQIINGAPADVFASANPAQMRAIIDEGMVRGEPVTFAENRLAFIVSAENPAGVASLADLAEPEVRLVVGAESVPVRAYTDELLARAAADPTYSTDFRAGVMANIVSEEANVRQVAAKVSLGEADAGIVYASDVTPDIAPNIRQVPIPDALNVTATYPIAVITGTDRPENAADFVAFVASDTGRRILQKWNLTSVSADE